MKILDYVFYVSYVECLPFIILCIGSSLFFYKKKNICFLIMSIASFIASLNAISKQIWPYSVVYDMDGKLIEKTEHLLPLYVHGLIAYHMLLIFSIALLVYIIKTIKTNKD